LDHCAVAEEAAIQVEITAATMAASMVPYDPLTQYPLSGKQHLKRDANSSPVAFM
jgi:hypothetical protein